MSYITDAVIFVGYANDAQKARLTEPLPFDTERCQAFRPINMDDAGGSKWFCSDIYAAALNHINADDLEDWFRSLPWGAYDSAVMIADTESEFRHLVTINWKDAPQGWGT